jgi:hypothetical protein
MRYTNSSLTLQARALGIDRGFGIFLSPQKRNVTLIDLTTLAVVGWPRLQKTSTVVPTRCPFTLHPADDKELFIKAKAFCPVYVKHAGGLLPGRVLQQRYVYVPLILKRNVISRYACRGLELPFQ